MPANDTITPEDLGTFTLTATLKTAGTQSITATDTTTGSLKGTESAIVVSASAAQSLKVSGFPTADTAGASGSVVITAYDAYGNVASGYTGTVALTSSDLQALIIPTTYSFTGVDAGQHIFPATAVTLYTAGSQSINATDTTTSSITGSESNINVQAAAASTLEVGGFPSIATAGVAGKVSVTVYDAYGNVATGYTGTVAFSSSDSRAVLPAAYTFSGGDAGTHTFPVTFDTAGTQSIMATDTVATSLTDDENGIAVRPAAANTLAVASFPVADTAGTANNVTVTAYDAYGNLATGYTGTVAFSSSDGHALLPANFTFSAADAGTHTISVTLETAGMQSFTATDSSNSALNGSETGITVQPAALAKLLVTGFPTNPTAGTAYNFAVSRDRCLWQRDHRLSGHGQLEQHGIECVVLTDQLRLHVRRRRNASLLCHARDRGASVDQGIRHHEQHQRQRDRHHSAARRARQTDCHRLPDQSHRRNGLQFHGQRDRWLRQRDHGLSGYGQLEQHGIECVVLTDQLHLHVRRRRERIPSLPRSRPRGISRSGHPTPRTASAAARPASRCSPPRWPNCWSRASRPIPPPERPTILRSADRCLWQRDHGLSGHGQLEQHRFERVNFPGRLHLHRRRRRDAFLLRHARDRGASVDQGIRHHEQHQRQRDRHRGAAGIARQTGRHRLPERPHRRHGVQLHGQRHGWLRQRDHRLYWARST